MDPVPLITTFNAEIGEFITEAHGDINAANFLWTHPLSEQSIMVVVNEALLIKGPGWQIVDDQLQLDAKYAAQQVMALRNLLPDEELIKVDAQIGQHYLKARYYLPKQLDISVHVSGDGSVNYDIPFDLNLGMRLRPGTRVTWTYTQGDQIKNETIDLTSDQIKYITGESDLSSLPMIDKKTASLNQNFIILILAHSFKPKAELQKNVIADLKSIIKTGTLPEKSQTSKAVSWNPMIGGILLGVLIILGILFHVIVMFIIIPAAWITMILLIRWLWKKHKATIPGIRSQESLNNN